MEKSPSKSILNLSSSNPQPPLSSPPFPPTLDPKTWAKKINFGGWRPPGTNWTSWVQKMASLHSPTWKKAGIHEAILNSTFQIRRNYDIIIGVAEKWCNETKNFVFPWGKPTITLEDIMILGGYSVSGPPVSTSVETTGILKETETKLRNACKELSKSQSKKTMHKLWTEKFMDSNEVEHEAFLALWLSRFVFPCPDSGIVETVFPLAIELAYGNRVALASAVLASVYRDLGGLKELILAIREGKSNVDELPRVCFSSPFQLVQVWAWERFVELRPRPNLIGNGEARLAKWHGRRKTNDVRAVLHSAQKRFEWKLLDNGITSAPVTDSTTPKPKKLRRVGDVCLISEPKKQKRAKEICPDFAMIRREKGSIASAPPKVSSLTQNGNIGDVVLPESHLKGTVASPIDVDSDSSDWNDEDDHKTVAEFCGLNNKKGENDADADSKLFGLNKESDKEKGSIASARNEGRDSGSPTTHSKSTMRPLVEFSEEVTKVVKGTAACPIDVDSDSSEKLADVSGLNKGSEKEGSGEPSNGDHGRTLQGIDFDIAIKSLELSIEVFKAMQSGAKAK